MKTLGEGWGVSQVPQCALLKLDFSMQSVDCVLGRLFFWIFVPPVQEVSASFGGAAAIKPPDLFYLSLLL